MPRGLALGDYNTISYPPPEPLLQVRGSFVRITVATAGTKSKTAGRNPPFVSCENFVHFEVLVNGWPAISKRLSLRHPSQTLLI